MREALVAVDFRDQHPRKFELQNLYI